MLYMRLVPRRNSFELLDNFFDDDFFQKRNNSIMKTDIKETDNEFIIEMDLPGYSKDNINLSLKDGYLKVHAKVEKENNNDENEKYICHERFYGECSRNFYVGDLIKEEDIDAEFKDGILKVNIPKVEEQEKIEAPKRIEIK